MDMTGSVGHIVAEARHQLAQGLWEPTRSDIVLARRTAQSLAEAVGRAPAQTELPSIERLARVREALACVALAVARTHGHLAWFLGRCGSELAPALHWGCPPAPQGRAFGTALPTPGQLGDAEEAIRILTAALTGANAASRSTN
ncbi:hypothetical protein ACGFX4_40435 [Kitasatospora sp. NPDC048365]|uniref:hypothetical protein n=1 Tax=Kitasatospora sp. NPDC048365 TaxID=3364050 RepID=UPI003713A04D